MVQTLKNLLSYPKLLAFALSCLLAYALFEWGAIHALTAVLNGQGYVSVFIGGMLFSFGFTTPFAIALFAELGDSVVPWLAAPIAGFGAALSDLCIFTFARLSFADELQRLSASSIVQRIRGWFTHPSLSDRLRPYLLWSFAGILIASPLPDEFGVTLLSGIARIDSKRFVAVCYLLNTVGILFIFLMARAASA